MAVMTQLQLEGSSTVYDLNDARISSTSVSTATHFLGTNSSVSAINPISASDLASVLGAIQFTNKSSGSLNNIITNKFFRAASTVTNVPSVYDCFGVAIFDENGLGIQLLADLLGNAYVRAKNGTGWKNWKKITDTDVTS